jgi:hypothetical protein
MEGINEYFKKFNPRIEESGEENSELLPNIEDVITEASKLYIDEEKVISLEIRYKAKFPEKDSKHEIKEPAKLSLARNQKPTVQVSDMVQPFHQNHLNGSFVQHPIHEGSEGAEDDSDASRSNVYEQDGVELQDFNQ